jgi:hypothetical protein
MSRNYIYKMIRARSAYFSHYDYMESPHNLATFARWNFYLGLDDTSAGQNVINIKAASQANLSNVNVGDPIRLEYDSPSWLLSLSPTTLKAYFFASIVAKSSTSVTISRDLPGAIAAANNHTMDYAYADHAHLEWEAMRSLHYELWNPSFKRYMIYTGSLLARVNQTNSIGRTVSGSANVAGTNWEAAAWPPKPGSNRSASAIHNITLISNNDAVRFPGISCSQVWPHVVRFSVVSLNKSGKNTLQCWVEDSGSVVRSSVVTPNMYGGIDMVNIPFTPVTTGNHYLKIKQNGATNASCYIGDIEYRQIYDDWNSIVFPAIGTIYYQGDSNAYNTRWLYGYIDPLIPIDLTNGRGIANTVSGRHLASQIYDTKMTMPPNIVVAVSMETANCANLQRVGTPVDMTPIYTSSEIYTATKYSELASYWRRLVNENINDGLCIFIGEMKMGEHATYGWDFTSICADMDYAARGIL